LQEKIDNPVKAIVLDEKILCGKCGHTIALKKEENTIRLKCKHRDNGKNCNVINEIKI